MENKDVEVIKFDLGYFITSQGLPPPPQNVRRRYFTKFSYYDSPLSMVKRTVSSTGTGYVEREAVTTFLLNRAEMIWKTTGIFPLKNTFRT